MYICYRWQGCVRAGREPVSSTSATVDIRGNGHSLSSKSGHRGSSTGDGANPADMGLRDILLDVWPILTPCRWWLGTITLDLCTPYTQTGHNTMTTVAENSYYKDNWDPNNWTRKTTIFDVATLSSIPGSWMWNSLSMSPVLRSLTRALHKWCENSLQSYS